MEKRRRVDGDLKSNPVVFNLVGSFFAIILNIGLQAGTSDALIQLVNALSNIYKNLDLQTIILSLIQERQNDMGSPLFIEFFRSNLE